MLSLKPWAAIGLGWFLGVCGALATNEENVGFLGYTAESAAAQRKIDARIRALADADHLRSFSQTLAARPHVAGTPAQAATRDFVIQQMQSWELATEVAEYEVYLPFPIAIELERVEPAPKQFDLREPALADDKSTQTPLPFPQQHGYAGAGDVSAELVYAHYGRDEDFDRLEELGIEVRGRIAIVRYGRGYRGLKVKNAQERGAVGCIIYSDPQDDGFFKGDVYPAGPMRPAGGVQHGSVKVGPPGDPTTPGRPSLPDVERVDPADAADLMKIPSVPIGYGVAGELLEGLGGPEVPQQWQGVLPFRYHLGPGPLRVHLRVEHDGGYRKIWNTFGRIEGSLFPDEWIIIGGHRDAWCAGAADNVSGTSVVLETARICAELARSGHRPKRTLIFATWDAEEWGIVGSAEWVEQHRDELTERVVAYINQDMVATGDRFSASAAPALKQLLTEITRGVPQPGRPEQTVYDTWAAGKDHPPLPGTPGGGSDHAPFFLHLGLPVTGHGFGGRQGIYHSLYDTPVWMQRFGDPGYEHHRANAVISAVLMMRLANADLLPFDHVRAAQDLTQALEKLAKDYEKLDSAAELDQLRAAATAFEQAARAARAFIEAADIESLGPERLAALNRDLRRVGPALTRCAADPSAQTAFYQNLLYGLAGGGGYRAQTLPGLRNAIAAADATQLASESALLTRQLEAAARLLHDVAGENVTK